LSPSRALLTLPLLLGVLRAQDPATFSVATQLVQVPVTVRDRHGVALQNLKAEDFRLFDNGVRAAIQHVWRESDLPLTIGLIVDVSYSEHSSIREERQAVAEFLNRMMRPVDRAFLLTVATRTTLLTDLTDSIDDLRQGLAAVQPETSLYDAAARGRQLGEPCPTKLEGTKVVSRCGGSAIWDAVSAAARLRLRTVAGSKALIVLSDGLDTGSMHTLDRAIQEVQLSDTTVYGIKVGDVRAILAHGLSTLAAETGGEQFRPSRNNFAEIFRRIEDDLRTRYVLALTPNPATARPGLHRLRVEVTRPGAIVRARASYYSQASPE